MKLNGSVSGLTPTINVANWILETTSSTRVDRILEVYHGGELTSSTAMRTRYSRDSAVGTGARTAGNVQRLDQGTVTPGNAAFFSTTYGTTQPTIQAGSLFMCAWNANGGFVRWLAAPGEEWINMASLSIESRADLGTGQSSYGVVWEEL